MILLNELDRLYKKVETITEYTPDPGAFEREWAHFSKRPGRPLTDEDRQLAYRFWTLGQLSTSSAYAAESEEYFRDFPPERMKR